MRLRSLVLSFVAAVALAGCNAQGEVKRDTPPRPVMVAEIHYAPRVADRVRAELFRRIGLEDLLSPRVIG